MNYEFAHINALFSIQSSTLLLPLSSEDAAQQVQLVEAGDIDTSEIKEFHLTAVYLLVELFYFR